MLLKCGIGAADSAAPDAGWLPVWGVVVEEIRYLIYTEAQVGASLTPMVGTKPKIAASFFFLKGRLT